MDKEQQPAPKTKELSGDVGVEKAERKAVFKVVPNRGGFAPGVDPRNLKQIIFDLEDEEFLERLGGE